MSNHPLFFDRPDHPIRPNAASSRVIFLSRRTKKLPGALKKSFLFIDI
jgi:hypothetical protein